jgi:hypothetical protein
VKYHVFYWDRLNDIMGDHAEFDTKEEAEKYIDNTVKESSDLVTFTVIWGKSLPLTAKETVTRYKVGE